MQERQESRQIFQNFAFVCLLPQLVGGERAFARLVFSLLILIDLEAGGRDREAKKGMQIENNARP